MKKNFLFIIVAAMAMSMASCSTGRYLNNSSNVNLNQTQVVLSQANFKVVKQISATYVYKSTMKFNADQLKESAYAALVKEAKLTGSQTIVNITMEQVDRASGMLIPKYQQAIVVSGTVIEFIK